jgi:hypothetical protein
LKAVIGFICIAYKKNQMSTDRESGRGNKRARIGETKAVIGFAPHIFHLSSSAQ